MEKQMINAGDYTLALIKGIAEDGKIVCNISGSREIEQLKEDGTTEIVEIPLHDTDISVPNGLYFTVTKDELNSLKDEAINK